jgi:hypothetical protein
LQNILVSKQQKQNSCCQVFGVLNILFGILQFCKIVQELNKAIVKLMKWCAFEFASRVPPKMLADFSETKRSHREAGTVITWWVPILRGACCSMA